MRPPVRRLAPITIVSLLLTAALAMLAIERACSRSGTQHEPQAACEPESRDEFLRAQRETTFPIYCPTFLPEDFRLERFHFGLAKYPRGVIPPPDSASLIAVFRNATTGTQITFGQGNLGNALFPTWLEKPPTNLGRIAYGREVRATLYTYTIPREPLDPRSAVWGSEDGHQHVITGRGVDAETLQTIAEGMLRLGPLNHVQSAGR